MERSFSSHQALSAPIQQSIADYPISTTSQPTFFNSLTRLKHSQWPPSPSPLPPPSKSKPNLSHFPALHSLTCTFQQGSPHHHGRRKLRRRRRLHPLPALHHVGQVRPVLCKVQHPRERGLAGKDIRGRRREPPDKPVQRPRPTAVERERERGHNNDIQ